MKYTSFELQKEHWRDKKNKRDFSHPVVEFFARQRIEFMKRHTDFAQIRSAFEIGCGDGFALYYMAREIETISGGDISEAMLAANPLNDGRLKIINAESPDIPDKSYDLVYCWEVLHHLENPLKCLCEMKRAARKYVAFFEPNRDNLFQYTFGLLKKEERGTCHSSKENLISLCSEAGLEVVSHAFCGWIFPNMTPEFIFRALKYLPFKSVRYLGISNFVVCRVPPEREIRKIKN